MNVKVETQTIELNNGGAYLKVCKWCEQEFHGIKTQKYCCSNHRDNYNNNRRAQEDKYINAFISEVREIYKLLKTIDEQGINFRFTPDILEVLKNAPAIINIDKHDDGTWVKWRCLADYIILIMDESDPDSIMVAQIDYNPKKNILFKF